MTDRSVSKDTKQGGALRPIKAVSSAKAKGASKAKGSAKAKEETAKAGDARPPRRRKARLETLENSLGHDFADRDLLRRAVTHASAPGADGGSVTSNERLEFLGDRVLGLLIAEHLGQLYPDAPEGELAVRLNDLVRQKTLADIAGKIGLGDYLVMSAGETRAGGREKPAILADACEAVIAALYLDGGLEAARAFVKAKWGRRLASRLKLPRDAKTALQEWAQAQGRPLPSYRLAGRTGPDHDPAFEVELVVKGLDPSIGTGGSKQMAEQAAARALLIREHVWTSDE